MESKDIVIKFDHVTKMYKLFKNDKKRLLHTFFKKIKYKEKKAVNDVSFCVRRGEAVALFGKNGAGKSTILKMITGVAFPTTGTIEVNGRVSALLELTSGFDPEFTGRENIYLKGQLLGLKDSEIKELEQEIIDFAELAAYDLRKPVTISFYENGVKVSCDTVYSAQSMAYNANTSGYAQTEINLYNEMLQYCDSANAHFIK